MESLNLEQANQVLVEGWLQREEDDEWKPRYVVCSTRRLEVFADPYDLEPSRALTSVPLDSVSAIEFQSGKKFFSVGFGSKLYHFTSASRKEQEKWCNVLKSEVPRAKLIKTQLMMQAKAESQAAKDFAEIQRKSALNSILQAELLIRVLPDFRSYAQELAEVLRLLIYDCDVVAKEGMNGAKPLADNTISLIDASNSTIAISRNREVKEKIAWFTRRVTSTAATMLTYAKSASLDTEAQFQFQDHMNELKRVIADFLVYLENMSSVDDIANAVERSEDAIQEVVSQFRTATSATTTGEAAGETDANGSPVLCFGHMHAAHQLDSQQLSAMTGQLHTQLGQFMEIIHSAFCDSNASRAALDAALAKLHHSAGEIAHRLQTLMSQAKRLINALPPGEENNNLWETAVQIPDTIAALMRDLIRANLQSPSEREKFQQRVQAVQDDLTSLAKSFLEAVVNAREAKEREEQRAAEHEKRLREAADAKKRERESLLAEKKKKQEDLRAFLKAQKGEKARTESRAPAVLPSWLSNTPAPAPPPVPSAATAAASSKSVPPPIAKLPPPDATPEEAALREAQQAVEDVANDFKRLACKQDVVREKNLSTEQVDTLIREQGLNLEPSAIDDVSVWVVDISPELLTSVSGLSDLIRELLSASVAAYQELISQEAVGGASFHTLGGDRVDLKESNAEYLVFAARLLVPAVKRLLKVVRNNDGDEAVVAAARVLKGATARLVSSCRAKLAPTSPSGQRLKAAANAVYFKTQALSDDVMWSKDADQADQASPGAISLKAKMESKHALSRKELELEERRRRLITLRNTPGSKSNRLSMKVSLMETEFEAQHRIALAERQVCRLKGKKPAEQPSEK